jgi:membrane protein implicated in regulation of membrane protease activity
LLGWLFFVSVILLFFLFATLASITATASAQEFPGNDTATPTETEEQVTELYDQLFELDVHSVEYVETDELGHAVKVVATWNGQTPERFTVTQIPDGKDVAIERRIIRPDEKTEFTIDLIDDSPSILYTSESISEGRALKLKDESSWLISGPWDATDAQVSALAGLLAGLSVVATLAVRKVRSDTDDPERVL